VLAPILMSVAELKDLELAEEDLALLDTLERSALRGADLIKQLLTFARGGDEQRSLVDPSLIAAEVQALVRDTFPRNLAFSLSVTRAPWGVHGNATELHQVLMNLCVNARDAMPDGGRLSVALENVRLRAGAPELPVGAAPGDWVLLAVSDTGPGIPPELRERIFEPFFTTKQLGQGTGLGLSTTLNIVKRLGGFIALESGPGATFKVYLPAVKSSQPAGRAGDEAPLPRGRGELVLVVDDEPGVRSVAKKILERFGYRVLVAAGGEEALLRFGEEPSTALVLTDLSMPGMDGATLISALKARAPSLQVLCSSGFASDAQLGKIKAAGVERLLDKPYTAEGLLREVDRALHGGG
jgi:CheY-like chemotaxis protein